MKGGSRALILSIGIFLLWSTIFTAPLRFFAFAFRNTAWKVLDAVDCPPVLSGILIVLFLSGLSIALLIASVKPMGIHLGGLCALISLSYYVYSCIQMKSLDENMITVTIGLIVALLFLLFQTEKPNLWLADAYTLAIPVMLFFDLVASPIFTVLHVSPSFLSPVITVPVTGIADLIGDFLTLPMPVWTIFLFAITATGVVFFARSREV